MRSKAAIATTLALALNVAGPATAAPGTITEAINDGKLEFDLRYRYEWVEQDGFDLNANANTLRLRLGWTTGAWHGFYARAAFDGNLSLGSERYNSTANGNVQYPVVADPQDSQLNQGYLAYTGPRELNALIGRQTLNLDNQRFIGSVAFRQLEQRFDNLRFNIKPVEALLLDYMYADKVYRVFGEHNPNTNLAEQDIAAHLLNVSWNFDAMKLVGYYYAVNFEDEPADLLNSPLTSQQSIGARFTGMPRLSPTLALPFQLEYSRQSDYGNAESDFKTDYGLAEIGISTESVTGKIGFELLGSDQGERAFQTPLATLHKFSGWADVFLATPAAGLRDSYALVQGKVSQVNLMAVYHAFAADVGSFDYGREWDLRAWWKRGIYHVELKYADYNADNRPDNPTRTDPLFDRDKRIFWFTLGLAL